MATTIEHLHPSALSALELSDEERIEQILGDRWIGYPRAVDLLKKLEFLFNHPKRERMPNLLLTGDTNNGKTMIVRQFRRRHPTNENPVGDASYVPVLVVEMPAVPDENRMYMAMLDAIPVGYRELDNIAKKQNLTLKMLRYTRTKMLIFDETNNLTAAHITKQKGVLNAWKYLGNELQIPIIATGTREAIRAIHSDPQLANRFKPASLPLWTLDRSFLQLLASFERMLPLKSPSNLAESTIATKIMSMGEGLIGEFAEILQQAAIYAIKTGREAIDMKVLMSIDWTSPSARRRHAERTGR